MRIIIIAVPSFPQLSETFIVNKFLGLLDEGWEAHVVCAKSEAVNWSKYPQLNERPSLLKRVHRSWPHRPRWLAGILTPIAIIRCLLLNPIGTCRYITRGWHRFGIDILRLLYLDAELICLKPDLIHFEFGATAADRIYLKDLLNTKVVVSFRGYDLNLVSLNNSDYYQQVWDHADLLHVLGEDLWQRARKLGCPSSKPHALIPPAIDTGFFDPDVRKHTEVAGTAARSLRILSVGRLDWRKGYEYALQAVQILTAQGIKCEYRIIGDGDFREAVAFARVQMGLEENVELLGAKTPDEIKSQMLWADVFLHAAVSEGFCNTVIEAQAMALPVVCSDAGGLPANVEDGCTGFITERRRAAPLAEKLNLLAADPSLRQLMGHRGRQRAVIYFNLRQQISDFDRLYRQMMQLPFKSQAATAGLTSV